MRRVACARAHIWPQPAGGACRTAAVGPHGPAGRLPPAVHWLAMGLPVMVVLLAAPALMAPLRPSAASSAQGAARPAHAQSAAKPAVARLRAALNAAGPLLAAGESGAPNVAGAADTTGTSDTIGATGATGTAAAASRAWSMVLPAADDAERALESAPLANGVPMARPRTDRAALREGRVRAAIADVRAAVRATPADAARLLAHAQAILARLD